MPYPLGHTATVNFLHTEVNVEKDTLAWSYCDCMALLALDIVEGRGWVIEKLVFPLFQAIVSCWQIEGFSCDSSTPETPFKESLEGQGDRFHAFSKGAFQSSPAQIHTNVAENNW